MNKSSLTEEKVWKLIRIIYNITHYLCWSRFNDTRKVKVLSLPETIKEKSTFRAKALRRELVTTTSSGVGRRAFARNVHFSFIVSGSGRTFTFRVSLNTLPTLATLVRDMVKVYTRIRSFIVTCVLCFCQIRQ